MTTSRRDFVASAGLGLAALGLPALRLSSASTYDLIIRGAAVYGGAGEAGTAGMEMDVGVKAGRITAISRRIAGKGADEIVGKGLALAPGFIDIHSHADGGLAAGPAAESVIRQGVTTVVVGQDGGSRVRRDLGAVELSVRGERVRSGGVRRGDAGAGGGGGDREPDPAWRATRVDPLVALWNS